MPDWKKVFVNRQEFLKLLGLTLNGVIGLMTVVPAAGFVFGYLFQSNKPKWINIGTLDNYKPGETVDVKFQNPYSLSWDGIGANRTAWVHRTADGNLMAFAINCTHLGCPLRWEAGAQLFMCPCHGGVFYSNGEVATGPPLRPMNQYPVRIENGEVEILITPVLTRPV